MATPSRGSLSERVRTNKSDHDQIGKSAVSRVLCGASTGHVGCSRRRAVWGWFVLPQHGHTERSPTFGQVAVAFCHGPGATAHKLSICNRPIEDPFPRTTNSPRFSFRLWSSLADSARFRLCGSIQLAESVSDVKKQVQRSELKLNASIPTSARRRPALMPE